MRGVAAYGLPNALRMSVGTEEANRLVVKALRSFWEGRRDERATRSRSCLPRKAAMSVPEPLFRRLALIGVGLIGSSIARAARAQNAVREIVATARTAETRARVSELGIADEVAATPPRGGARRRSRHRLHPVGAYGVVAEEIGPHLKAGAIGVGRRVREGLGWSRICARTCPQAFISFPPTRLPAPSIPSRFRFRRTVRQPLVHPHSARERDPTAVERLAAFWSALGANVETMTVEHHDVVLAMTSHLPHLIAYTVVGMADDLEKKVESSEVMKFSAGGFRDFTRIAASDPTMWRDVFLHNKDAVLELLGRSTRISRGLHGRSAGARAKRCSNSSPARGDPPGIGQIGQDPPRRFRRRTRRRRPPIRVPSSGVCGPSRGTDQRFYSRRERLGDRMHIICAR